MVSAARAEARTDGYYVIVWWGGTKEMSGPYRWLWLARFLAWLNDGIH